MTSESRSEDLVHLNGVHIASFHFEKRIQYVRVQSGNEVIKVRVYDSPEKLEWLKAHAHDRLDLTIFPYKWSVKGASGVVNYLRYAEVSKGES